VLKAAKTLAVHPHTIYARLRRIFDVSDPQARSFDALTELLIVCDCPHGGVEELFDAGGQSPPSEVPELN
jgi:hypothetical protein